jgi:predicted O-linked N-acetylglucosamine transferase (SPINDLY family)
LPVPETKLQQAQALINAGRPADALAILRPFAPREPRNVQLASMMGLAALRAGMFDEAEYHARRALTLAPREAALRSNLAMTMLQRAGASRDVHLDAMRLLRETLVAIPHHMDALCTLAIMLLDENQPGELLRLCEAAVSHCRAQGLPDPADPQFSMFHSQVLCMAGRHAEAFAILDAAIARFPAHAGLRLAAAVPLHVMPGVTPAEIARRHKDYGVALCALQHRVRTHAATDPHRPLRIGVMSPDLRRHSVAFFTLPWFERIDKSRFEIYVYAIGHTHDDMSDRLKAHAKAWHALGRATDAEITKRILDDRVDILIELAGLTSEQRFSVLAAKPAPVLATYCGYPDTVGIPTIDERIVDSHTDPVTLPSGTPPGTPTFDERCVEHLIRLDPCFLCYTPPVGAPAVAGPPSERAGYPTFASFNSWRKLNPRVIELWARVLDAVPGSRMLIKCVDMRDDFSRGRVVQMLDGAIAGRYELLEPKATIEEHLALYARVDVALDTIPYHGTTTTCEAMFMGVPVVTLEGETHVSRVGVSLLRNIGLEELIARDDADFVRIAASLAKDAPRLHALRDGLRPRLLASPVCDAGAFTARFSAALRGMWARAALRTSASSIPTMPA